MLLVARGPLSQLYWHDVRKAIHVLLLQPNGEASDGQVSHAAPRERGPGKDDFLGPHVQVGGRDCATEDDGDRDED